jgi:Mg-chelatase subunit ChlD
MKIPNEGLLRIDARAEFDHISCGSETLCMTATITAPKIETNRRAPLNIVCVIDRSASMTNRMPLMKQTLSFMVKNMTSADTLTLITFDKTVLTCLPMTNMDAEGSSVAHEVISQTKVGNGTNLSGGLFEGFECLKKYSGDAVSSLMIFTDGEASCGLRSPAVLIERSKNYVAEIAKQISVFTFGYGKSHDANLLRSIAETGNGMYYFINNQDAIPTSFGDCMGGLMSVVAQHIKLRINLMPGVTLLNTVSAFQRNSEGAYLMGDLYSEERRDIVFDVLVAHTGVPEVLQNLAQFDLSYVNVSDHKEEQLSTFGVIFRTSILQGRQTNIDVDMQRNRARMALALKHSMLLAQYKLKEAKTLLGKTMEEISQSPSAKTAFVIALLETLQTAMDGLVDSKTYTSIGSKSINSAYMGSDRQRSNCSGSLSIHYTTTSKRMTSEEFSGEFSY